MKLHIMIFLPNLEGGGAERNMINLANGLERLGQEVSVVVGRAGGPYEEELSSRVRLVELHQDRALGCLSPLVEELEKSQPDWLFSTLNYANVIAIWAALLSSHTVKVAVREAYTFMGGDRRRQILEVLQLSAYRHANLVIAPSIGIAEELAERGIHADIVHNPVITPTIARLAAKPSPWPRPFVLAVGRLAHEKGFDLLLRSWASLDEGRDLVILGEGELRTELEELSAKLGIDESVYFPGFVDNPFQFMSNCDLFVLSSRYEGMPNVLIQAMACGAAVVATDCPTGPREILNQRSGRLVPVDDETALARAISESLSGRQEGQECLNDFDQNRVSEELLARLQQLTT